MVMRVQVLLDYLTGRFAGAQTLLAGSYSQAGIIYLLLLIATAVVNHVTFSGRSNRLLFWIFGFILVGFTLFRPMAIGRDDIAYIGIGDKVCPILDCLAPVSSGRDWVWYNLISIMRSVTNVSQALLTVAALGLFMKLWVIDRLCQQRLLALTLFFPLIYLQYDLTQLRAGLAMSWFFLAVYFLVKNRPVAGSSFLFTNFLVHSQAVFSPGVLSYRFLDKHIIPVWILMGLLVALACASWVPSLKLLELIGVTKFAPSYYQEVVTGSTNSVKAFPLGYLLILGYAAYLVTTIQSENVQLGAIVTASFLVGITVAWFFAQIPAIQSRVFEFYCAPLVLLAGNVVNSRIKIFVTIIASTTLYLRLELLNDWILG